MRFRRPIHNERNTPSRRIVIESRKQAVSIRMNAADVRKVKKLAVRLGVRDSDVIRFAVKSMLARLGPLHDGEVRGRNLVPVFVESGAELLRFFELDAARLEAIINEGADAMRRVEGDDIALIALTAAQELYAALKLRALHQREETREVRPGEVSDLLRRYLYEKYVFQPNGEANGAGESLRRENDIARVAAAPAFAGVRHG
jgi:hypothetical protein